MYRRRQPEGTVRWILLMDPPDHTRLRTLVVKGFSPRVVEAFRPRIAELADALLDRVRGAGTLELVRDFAIPLSSLVISELLGVPSADRDQFLFWAQEILDLLGGPGFSSAQATRVQGSLVQMEDSLRGLIAERRRTSMSVCSVPSSPPRSRGHG